MFIIFYYFLYTVPAFMLADVVPAMPDGSVEKWSRVNTSRVFVFVLFLFLILELASKFRLREHRKDTDYCIHTTDGVVSVSVSWEL